MSKINVTLGFDADTSQAQRRINELATSLRQLSAHPVELLDDTDLRDAIKAAKELETHLHKAYNVDTQKLDLSKFSKSLSAAGQDLNYFQKNLSKMGVDGEKAFLNLAKAIATADAPTFRLSGHVKNLFDELVKVGRWQFTSSVMHNLTGAVQTAYHYAQDLNESLTNIRIVTGQSTEEMAQFADKANAAAKALSTTTVKYSDAALIYYQQGLDDQQIEERTAITIKMANAAGQSVETVSDQLTSIWNNYYDGSKSLEYYADVLARLGADTASSSDEITEGLEKFSSVADTVGLSYEYAASALATVTATTRESANVVGTAFKTLFSRIQGLQLGDTLDDGTDLNKYSAALASVGVNIKDTNGDLKEMDTILDEVGARWNVLSKDQQMALAQTVAGVRQYTQFIALMDKWDYFQENLNSALNATGSLGEQAEIYADSWQAAEDKVRASAEGIYQALIDEETFIDLNNGLASVLQGVDGVVTGMGGMKGVLTTIGSLFLMIYSKEIPSAIDKVIGTFDILTGKAKKNMAVMQQQNINALTEFTGGERSAQIEADGLAKVARMKKELTDKSHMLSKAQIEEYQSKIQSVQGNYQKVQALYEEAEAQENLLERAEINYDQKMTRSVKDLALSLNDSWNQMENLANRFAQEEDENIVTSIIEDMNILQERINDTTEALKSLGLSDEEILTFRTNFDPTQKKQAEEVDVIYKKITKSIEEQRKKIVSLTKEQEKYRIIGKAVEDMKTVWDKNTNSVDKAKQAIKEYLKDLKVISKKENIKIDFSEDSMIGQFLIDLDKVELSADQLKQKFSEVLEEILKINTEGITDTEAEMGTLEHQVRTILDLMGQGDKFNSFFEVLRTQGAEAAMASLKASKAEEELKKQQEERIKIQAKLSSGIGEMAAQLMNINGLLASVGSISRLWNDEDASTLEKITAAMGLLYQQVQLVVGMYKAMTTVNEALAATKLKKAAAEGVDAAATKINTEVTKDNTRAVNKNKIAVMSHPYLAIAAIALMVIVTAIGAVSAAWEKDTEKIKKNAEEARKAADESKAQVDANTDLIRSMRELLDTYEKTGEGKEELDKVSDALAKAYNLEGAELAKLSGEYEHYQNLLNNTKEARQNELRLQIEKEKTAKEASESEVMRGAIEAQGTTSNNETKYNIKIGGGASSSAGWDNEAKAADVLAEYIEGSERRTTTLFDSVIHEGVAISIDNNINSMVRFYDQMVSAREEMDRLKLSQTDNYRETKEWIDEMSASIEAYKKHAQTLQTFRLASGEVNDPETIKNLTDYQEWKDRVWRSIIAATENETEQQEMFNAILGISTNPNLKQFDELNKALETIKKTSNVSAEELDKIWDSLSRGESKWSQQTLLTLNWAHLTDETWESAANSLEEYYKAVEKVTDLQETKTKAKEVLDLIEDGITSDNSAKIQSAFDWGKLDENGEQVIIEYSDFLKLTLKEQQEYLTQFTETSLMGSLQNQIEYNTEEIEKYKTYLKDSFDLDYSNIDEYLNSVNKLANLREWATGENGRESQYSDRQEGINWKILGFDSDPGIKAIREDKKIQEILNNYKEILNIKNKISNLSIANKDLEEQKKIEAYFKNNEAAAKRIVDQLKLDDIDFVLNPDDSRFQQVIDEIVNSDPSVKVLVKGEIDDSIKKLKEDTAEWLSAASMIGDDYQVATDKVDELAAAFPGILEGYSIVNGEMIQLKKEQVEAAIMTAQEEINANNIKQKYLYQIQLEQTKREKEELEKRLEDVNNNLKHQDESHKITYSSISAYNSTLTNDQENNVEGTTETIDTQNKLAADSYAQLYTSAFKSLQQYGEKVKRYYEIQKQLSDLERKYPSLSAMTINEKTQRLELKKELSGLQEDIVSEYKQVLPDNYQKGSENKTVDQYAQEYYEKYQASEFSRQVWELQKEEITKSIEEKNKQIAQIESSIAAIDAIAEANKRQLNDIGLGLGSDGEKSKSKEYEKEELNIYYQIDNEIDHINSLLEEQEGIISRTTEGSVEHYEALKQQEKLLNKLIEAHKKKKAIAEQDLTNIRPTIESSAQKIGKTITYDDGGMINEREDIVQYYNDAVEKAASDERKEALETEKDVLLELIDDYNKTIELIRELNAAITESEYAILDIDITLAELAEKRYEEELKKSEERQKKEEERQKKVFEGLKTELDLKIQIDENSLKKLDYYLDKLSDDFYQMAEAMEVMMKKVPVMESSLGNYENFYNKLQSAWAAGDINSDDYLEGLQQSYDGILDNLSSLVALDKEMIHYYEDTLAAAEDELSHYTDSLEHLTSVLEHYKNIIELVDGEYNFEGVDTILRGQAKTIENQMQVAESNYQLMLRQKEMAEEAIRGVDRDSAAWVVLNNKLQAATEAVNRAEEEMLSKTEEWAEAMKAVMENTFAEAAYNMEMAMTQGMGFDMLNGSLDRLSAWQDVYLTTTNKIYEATKLMRTAQQAADKTDNVASKQKLNNYIKEMESLRDKTNLSKLDLDLAKARYDVLLAEIALEEAQNAKSTVRLQRDSEGNFGYVYTSDTDAIISAEQDLADAQNKLYNIGLDATNEYGEKMLELQQKLSDDLMQLEQDRANGRFAIEGSYEAARDQLIQEYRDLFIAYSEQYTTALESDVNIQEEAWVNAYDSMINQTQNWADYTEEYTNICENAYEQWRNAVTEHNEVIQDVLNNTKEKVDDVTDASDKLKDEVLDEVLPAIEDELDMVAELSDNYASLRDEILETIRYYENLIDTIEELIRKQAEAKAQEAAAKHDVSGVKDFSQAMADHLENGGKTTDDWYQALLEGREEKLKQDEYTQFGGEAATNLKTLMLKYEKYKAEGVTNDLTKYVESIDRNAGEYFDPDEVRRLIATFASGGYTGSWGPSGRLAILHQKELVLNANDTLHFLQAAEILRGVSEAIDLQAMANQIMLNPYAGALTSGLADQTLQQQVTIEANFPGVTDRFEIEEAFNNLINTASQYANRK